MRNAGIAVFLAFILAAGAAPARADVLEGFKTPELAWGGLEVHPFVRYLETYNSNILLKPDPTPTWIHQLDGGLKAAFTPSARHRLDLGYAASFQAYTRDPGVNNTLNQAVDGAYAFSGPHDVTVKLTDAYLNTADPPNSEQTDRLKRWQNAVALKVDRSPEGSRLFCALEASHLTHKYIADAPAARALFDRYEQVLGGRVGYYVMPKTRAYVAYRRGLIHYTVDGPPPSRASRSHNVSVGIEGDLAAKITGRLEGGVNERRYDEPPSPGGDRDARDGILAAAIDYRPIERTLISITATRALEEALFENNRYYVAEGGLLSVSHTLPAGLTLTSAAGMERDTFPEAATVAGAAGQRRDDVYQARAGCDYRMTDFLRVGAGYLHRARFSRHFSQQFGYRDHVGTVSAALTF